jgi:hypothetical protein
MRLYPVVRGKAYVLEVSPKWRTDKLPGRRMCPGSFHYKIKYQEFFFAIGMPDLTLPERHASH